jgi:hypothetical protein
MRTLSFRDRLALVVGIWIFQCLLVVADFPKNAIPPLDYMGFGQPISGEKSTKDLTGHSAQTHDYFVGKFESKEEVLSLTAETSDAHILGTLGELPNYYLVAFPRGARLPQPKTLKESRDVSVLEQAPFWEPLQRKQHQKKVILSDPMFPNQIHLVS